VAADLLLAVVTFLQGYDVTPYHLSRTSASLYCALAYLRYYKSGASNIIAVGTGKGDKTFE
jgi:hypothetical protein